MNKSVTSRILIEVDIRRRLQQFVVSTAAAMSMSIRRIIKVKAIIKINTRIVNGRQVQVEQSHLSTTGTYR
jgi:hypothetical protein